MDDKEPVYLLMMGNTKPCEKVYIKKLFDLKGSMVQRETTKDLDKNTMALKDMNLLNLTKNEAFIRMYPEDIHHILDIMAYDISLVSQFNLMDYSLLFTVAFNPLYVEENKNQFFIDNKKCYNDCRQFSMKRKLFNDALHETDKDEFIKILN